MSLVQFSDSDCDNAAALSQFRCGFDGCSMVFKKQSRLDTHIRAHTGERPYTCEFEGCSKAYARLQHLKRHVENTHTVKDSSSSKYSCPHCQLKLADKYSLQKHINREHLKYGPKKYVCPEPGCDQQFLKRKQLITHRLDDHSNNKLVARNNWTCPHEGCNKVFQWETVLKRHLKVHKGYPCDTEGCDKVLPNWSSLRKHKATDHAKVFKCETCGSTFSRKPNLTQHMKRKHSECEAAFHCSVEGCDRVYNYQSSLTLHIREAHNGESVWRNKQRQRKKYAKKEKISNKPSFAAKLCGVDDRFEKKSHRSSTVGSRASVSAEPNQSEESYHRAYNRTPLEVSQEDNEHRKSQRSSTAGSRVSDSKELNLSEESEHRVDNKVPMEVSQEDSKHHQDVELNSQPEHCDTDHNSQPCKGNHYSEFIEKGLCLTISSDITELMSEKEVSRQIVEPSLDPENSDIMFLSKVEKVRSYK